ncbi:MAG: ZIP family metal transporter, partial [Rhodanobacter sp.]
MLALLGGCVAAAATALGTLPALFASRISQRAQDTMLGFGAGVMLAASAFSLALPGITAAKHYGAGPWLAGVIVSAAILAGGALLLVMDRMIPHEHFIKGQEGGNPERIKRAWLFVFAICLHNLPEGLAIGVGFSGTDMTGGIALTVGIAIQDIPEGLVVAIALMATGYARGFSVAVGMASGLVEPIGAVLGALIISSFPWLLPVGLGFAAGAMVFVVSHEIIPESHRQGHENYATAGLMFG